MPTFSELFRRDLRILEESEQFLLEASDYDTMFADIKPMLDPEYAAMLAKAVREAKRVLRRKDRVIWYLRQWKIGFMRRILMEVSGGEIDLSAEQVNRLTTLKDKACLAYSLKSGKTPREVYSTSYALFRDEFDPLGRLEHYLGLPIEQIETYDFGYHSARDIAKVFHEIEDDWKKQAGGGVGSDERDELVLDCGNGFKWFNLHRASCSDEGQAMGHCGNSPRSTTDDTILSLRRTTKSDGDRKVTKPYLTFILKSDGYLSEMKGRFNNSPANAAKKGMSPSAFTSEIEALLRLPLIKGITGGGYLPEENFKVADLAPETQEALFAEKPELATLSWLLEKHGETPEVAALFVKAFANSDTNYKPVYVEALNSFWMEKYGNLVDLGRYHLQAPFQSNVKEAIAANEGKEPHQGMFMPTDQMYLKLLAALRKVAPAVFAHFAASAVATFGKGDPDIDQGDPASILKLMHWWGHGMDVRETHFDLLNSSLKLGRGSYLADAGELYLIDWLQTTKPAPNKYDQVLVSHPVFAERRREMKTAVDLMAPFETLAAIADAGLMDKQLGNLLKLEDGREFSVSPDEIDMTAAVERMVSQTEYMLR